MDSSQLTYKDFIATIVQLCHSAMSGSVYFTSEQNTSGRVVLNGGIISAISYSNKRGWDAVALIPGIHHVRYRFDEFGAKAPPDDGLPGTDIILKTLAPEGMVLQAKRPASGNAITPKQRQIIENALIEIVGPVGSILCDDHITANTSIEQAFAALATELSPDEINSIKKLLS